MLDLSWGPDLVELANAHYFEYNESVNFHYILDEQKLEDQDVEEISDFEDNRDDIWVDEIDTLADEFASYLHYGTSPTEL